MTEELLTHNKTINLKDKEIEELNRRLLAGEEEFQANARSAKQAIDEQLHHAKMQHAADLKHQQDEIRNLRDQVSKFEERLKSSMQSEKLKETALMEAERRYNDLSSKISTVSNQFRLEKENNDRLCLENEELKRKVNKEEARCRRALEELKEYEEEYKANLESMKNQAKTRPKEEPNEEVAGGQTRVEGSDIDKKQISHLTKKVSELKEKLKMASDKLVKTISEKVVLIQKLRDLGVDLSDLDKPGKINANRDIFIVDQGNAEIAEKQKKDASCRECPKHHKHVASQQSHHHHHHHRGPSPGHHHHHHRVVEHTTPGLPPTSSPFMSQPGPLFNTEFPLTLPQLDRVPLSHESKFVPTSVNSTPFTTDGFQREPYLGVPVRDIPHGDHYLVDQKAYLANIQDLTEDELQLKIKHLLAQKESFFNNA